MSAVQYSEVHYHTVHTLHNSAAYSTSPHLGCIADSSYPTFSTGPSRPLGKVARKGSRIDHLNDHGTFRGILSSLYLFQY